MKDALTRWGAMFRDMRRVGLGPISAASVMFRIIMDGR